MRRALLPLLALGLLAGCLDDGADPLPAAPSAVTYPLPDAVTALEQVAAPATNGSRGSFIDEGRLYLSGSAGLRIFDIRDPARVTLLADNIPDTQGSSDVDVLHHPDGRTYAVLNVDGDGHVVLVDVTDPAAAAIVPESATDLCAHSVGVVTGTTVVYVSWSVCHATQDHQRQVAEGDVEVIDYADPMAPQRHLMEFPPVAMTVGGVPRPVTATSCHEISFNAELRRAYCSAISQTHVWDVSDPHAPAILQVIDDPLSNIHHGAWDARNGTLLILGDEFAGVLAPTPMCSDEVDVPTSALWFYDISDLANPRRVGYYQIPHDAIQSSLESGSAQYCSTHMGDVIDDDRLVMGWYTAGVVVVDFSDPAAATTLATWRAADSDVWEARYGNGHVFLSDKARGLDVLRLV